MTKRGCNLYIYTSLRLAPVEGFWAFGPSAALLRLSRNKRSRALRARAREEVKIRFKLMKVDDRRNIERAQKKKLPKTLPAPTRLLYVNISSIGSVFSSYKR